MAAQNPLNQEHCQCLNKVLESIEPALELAKKCENCGWDVTEFINQLKAQRTMATNAKREFFPHEA